MTNHSGEEFQAAAVEAGACGFLAKERLNELPGLLRRVDDNLPQPPWAWIRMGTGSLRLGINAGAKPVVLLEKARSFPSV